MRLWSLHPHYLDAKGLVALWRETLLAQAVLLDQTIGYQRHPQVARFRQQPDPLGALGRFLEVVFEESQRRGYDFADGKIRRVGVGIRMTVNEGQLAYEFQHLLGKLKVRDRPAYARCRTVQDIAPHPLFQVVPGGIEDWEVVKT